MLTLVTGAGGLIGSEAVAYYGRAGHQVLGIDNNMRRDFFGVQGDVTWNLKRLQDTIPGFQCLAVDIRDRAALEALFKPHRFDQIIHCAAQPSHDKAREIPLVDFEVNAVGTLNLVSVQELSGVRGRRLGEGWFPC